MVVAKQPGEATKRARADRARGSARAGRRRSRASSSGHGCACRSSARRRRVLQPEVAAHVDDLQRRERGELRHLGRRDLVREPEQHDVHARAAASAGGRPSKTRSVTPLERRVGGGERLADEVDRGDAHELDVGVDEQPADHLRAAVAGAADRRRPGSACPWPCAALIPGAPAPGQRRACPRGRRAPGDRREHGRPHRRRARLARGAARPRWRRCSSGSSRENSFTQQPAGRARRSRTSPPGSSARSALAVELRPSRALRAARALLRTGAGAAGLPRRPHRHRLPAGHVRGVPRARATARFGPGAFDMKGGIVVMLFGPRRGEARRAARARAGERDPRLRRGGRLAGVAAAHPRRTRAGAACALGFESGRPGDLDRHAPQGRRLGPRRGARGRRPRRQRARRRAGTRSGRSRGSSIAPRRSPTPRAAGTVNVGLVSGRHDARTPCRPSAQLRGGPALRDGRRRRARSRDAVEAAARGGAPCPGRRIAVSRAAWRDAARADAGVVGAREGVRRLPARERARRRARRRSRAAAPTRAPPPRAGSRPSTGSGRAGRASTPATRRWTSPRSCRRRGACCASSRAGRGEAGGVSVRRSRPRLTPRALHAIDGHRLPRPAATATAAPASARPEGEPPRPRAGAPAVRAASASRSASASSRRPARTFTRASSTVVSGCHGSRVAARPSRRSAWASWRRARQPEPPRVRAATAEARRPRERWRRACSSQSGSSSGKRSAAWPRTDSARSTKPDRSWPAAALRKLARAASRSPPAASSGASFPWTARSSGRTASTCR